MCSLQRHDDYTRGALDEAGAAPNPFRQFDAWFTDAQAADIPDPNAMTVATATADGQPSARIVLLRGYDERGFVFYTNYESRKGQELAGNPVAALVFFWPALERQIRITGAVAQASRDETDRYFRGRPRGSRLGAWASPQSAAIVSRAEIEDRLRDLEQQYPGDDIPTPPHWGGYRVAPDAFEFWQGRPSRLHDRLRYTRQPDGSWRIDRLAP